MTFTSANAVSKPFILKDVFAVCEKLTLIQKRRVVKLFGYETSMVEQPMSAGEALAVWMADLLQSSPVTDADQRWMAFDETYLYVQQYGDQLYKAIEKKRPVLPVAQLGLGDRNFVVVSGKAGALDLTTGEWLAESPPLLERILYDLARLFTYRQSACKFKEEARMG